MASTTDTPPSRAGRWQRLRRVLSYVALGYVGILLVLLALENWFIYHPVTAAQSWIEPTDPLIKDAYFDLPTGERIVGSPGTELEFAL